MNKFQNILVYLIVCVIVFIPLEIYIGCALVVGYYNIPMYFNFIVIITNVAWVWFLKSYGVKRKKPLEKQLEKPLSYIGYR